MHKMVNEVWLRVTGCLKDEHRTSNVQVSEDSDIECKTRKTLTLGIPGCGLRIRFFYQQSSIPVDCGLWVHLKLGVFAPLREIFFVNDY